VALLVDARRCILCHVFKEAGWTDGDDTDAVGDATTEEEPDCPVEKLSLLATVEGVAGYGMEPLGLTEDIEERRPDRLHDFLGTTTSALLLDDPPESPPPLVIGGEGPNGTPSPHGDGVVSNADIVPLVVPPFLDRPTLETGTAESPPLDSSELLLLLPLAPGRLDGVADGDDAAAFLGLVVFVVVVDVPNDPLVVRRVPRWLGVRVRERREGDGPASSCSDLEEDPRAWGVWGGGLALVGNVPSFANTVAAPS
jgi:hypothetical protein